MARSCSPPGPDYHPTCRMGHLSSHRRFTLTWHHSWAPWKLPVPKSRSIQCKGTVADWLAPSENVVYYMHSNIQTQLSAIVHETFENYIPGGLCAPVGTSFVAHPRQKLSMPMGAQYKSTLTSSRACVFIKSATSPTTKGRLRWPLKLSVEAHRYVHREHCTVTYELCIVSDDFLPR